MINVTIPSLLCPGAPEFTFNMSWAQQIHVEHLLGANYSRRWEDVVLSWDD